MKRVIVWLAIVGALVGVPAAAHAAEPVGDDPAATSTTITPATPEAGSTVPVPIAPSGAALVQVPPGCQSSPIASIVFAGTLIAKVTGVARYRVEQIRAGNGAGYIFGDLVDIHYDNETQYLSVNERYLVGAVPLGPNLLLSSKVRASEPLFGGNAVIGVAEKSTECPPTEDPVRTLHLDGTEVDNGLLMGLSGKRKEIALAFLLPLAVAFGIILVLVLVRWIFTAFFVTARHAAAGPRHGPHHGYRAR